MIGGRGGAMWDGYADVPVTSRAAEAELERQRARRSKKGKAPGVPVAAENGEGSFPAPGSEAGGDATASGDLSPSAG